MASSVSMVSMSLFGSSSLSTWATLCELKPRTTWHIALASRMLARNWLPRPSPSLAPFTSPAMSTKVTVAGMTFSESKMPARTSSRGSGMGTTPVLGSIVAKG